MISTPNDLSKMNFARKAVERSIRGMGGYGMAALWGTAATQADRNTTADMGDFWPDHSIQFKSQT